MQQQIKDQSSQSPNGPVEPYMALPEDLLADGLRLCARERAVCITTHRKIKVKRTHESLQQPSQILLHSVTMNAAPELRRLFKTAFITPK